MLTIRCCKILSDLLMASSPVDKHVFMDKYNVSERSIKYDINRLRSWLNDKKSHVNIAYIPKLGFELSGNSADIYNLQQIYNKETETTIVFSTERLRHIILTLLTEKKFITVNDLAKYLMVSKNTISRDIDTVQNMLEVWDIYIDKKAHWGMKLVTNEPKRRQAIEYFILSMFNARETEKILDVLKGSSIPLFLEKIICRYLIPKSDLENLCKLFAVLLQRYKAINIVDTKGSLTLFIRICVSINRLRNKFPLSEVGNIIDQSENCNDIVTKQLLTIFSYFSVTINLKELNWLLLPLNKKLIDPGIDIEKITLQLIQRTSHVTKIPFSADCNLYENLLMHIKRTFIKKQSYVVNVNPMLDEIIRNFKTLFDVIKQICYDIFNNYNIYLHDEDISYIVLYFQLSYETILGKKSIRTLVVCSTGVSSAKLLMAQLKNKFNVLQIMGCCSVLNVEEIVKNNPIDLVISVLPLKITIPSVVVNAILQNDDIKRIKSTLANFKLKPNNTMMHSEETILTMNNNQSELKKQEKFTQAVISRGFGIAMQLKKTFNKYLNPQTESGLMLHCLLMSNRFACKAPYTDITCISKEQTNISAVKEKIRQIMSAYYSNVPDSEIIAIFNYLTIEHE
ncbi:BglG family transcription antiterminator [Pectinatus frisingensis]|uniref:BglG family transcription antiterminator n=1 Tax=Pectinatus frisingensis TaxID=865 RepID=UPI0018C5F31F|nr:PRD domain-containing protein [Pectinatus frisingensis]